MAASAIGVIFSNLHEETVPELVRRRTMASIPFGGRYRVIDFMLSNMVNSGITTVGLLTNNNYRSLIDHIGSGKDWYLARKDGGIILLPPFSDRNNTIYTTRLEALNSLQGFFNRRSEKYVVLYDCDNVAKFDAFHGFPALEPWATISPPALMRKSRTPARSRCFAPRSAI